MQSKVKVHKSELRSDLLQQIRKASATERKTWSDALQKNLKTFLQSKKGFWGAFYALSDEPQIDWAIVSDQIHWCFPRTQNENMQFKFAATKLQRSDLGTQEPVDGTDINSNELQGVVVPALAFSKSGYRLGRGKGYYDRYLSHFNGKKIGVCFELTCQSELPHEEHDILFNHIVTESSVYHVGHPEGDRKWN